MNMCLIFSGIYVLIYKIKIINTGQKQMCPIQLLHSHLLGHNVTYCIF
jgi:hypothetical protein